MKLLKNRIQHTKDKSKSFTRKDSWCNCFVSHKSIETQINTDEHILEKKIEDHAKYITAQKFNKLIAENVTARLKQADLVSKIDFDNKLTSVNKAWKVQKKKFRS